MGEMLVPKRRSGLALIFGGPHAAGKDTVANQFAAQVAGVSRIVRYITRPPAQGESDGVDYHFVDVPTFTTMAANDEFLEHASFPGVMSGTSKAEVESKLGTSRFATMTANFEDGLSVHWQLRDRRLASLCFFVAPCQEEVMLEAPEEYKAILLRRMISRGRSSDQVEGRLIMADRYRQLYIENNDSVSYIANVDGKLPEALAQVTRAILTCTTDL